MSEQLLQTSPPQNALDLAGLYRHVRDNSEHYCSPLCTEDYGLQAVAETSPAKWHLAHTSWFFETFLLKPFLNQYRPFNNAFEYLFNSYYNGIGDQFPRAQRGLLSRPTVSEVYAYRQAVDNAMYALIDSLTNHSKTAQQTIRKRLELGLQHELQHQELFFTDIKFNLAQNPLNPSYIEQPEQREQLDKRKITPCTPLTWQHYEPGIRTIGTNQASGFCFDNETPKHRVFLEAFSLASRPLTNGEVIDFIRDGGYQTPSLWLADGWATVQSEHWQHPLYWKQTDNGWFEFTLHGLQPLDLAGIACHLSAYEADALARWSQARLPTEFEWETAAQGAEQHGHFVDQGHYHPRAPEADTATLFGSVWEWTSSAYSPYPGFRPASGAIGEYNGKFMCNQLVLRGGSCVSDPLQLRASYRNFFYPQNRWQFSGVRFAKDRS